MNQYIDGNYIAVFPFCSSKHKEKNGLIFGDLIKEMIKIFTKVKYNVVVAPGPKEIL